MAVVATRARGRSAPEPSRRSAARRRAGRADARAPLASSSTSRCATGSSSSARALVLVPAPGSRSSARCSPTHKPLEFTGADRPAAVVATTGSARPRTARTSSRSSSTACARRSSSACVGGGIAWLLGAAVGFTAGYRGGWVDDVLNMLTNVVLVIPTLAILIIVAAYLNVHSYVTEAILIGLTSWPWAARAVRAQTFSLKTRDFVDIARLSGRKTRQIIATRDRAEHELVPADDVHPALRRRDPDRRVARLPRPRPVDVRSRSG